ncbi:MAG: hypothetical protein JKY19_06955 [Alcanivoracaceae bacterium]|nr:hypothetical protein [Alcanivoracaceae bacterium]
MTKLLTIFLLSLPFAVFASDKPSMTSMWLELIFLIVMMISLKIADFSVKNKFIIFASYILSGIITKTIWFPVVLWVVMYFIFRSKADDETF